MDPVSGAVTGVKIVSLSSTALRDLHRRNEVGNLFAAIPKAVRRDHRVPADHHDEVMRAVDGLKVDPHTGGCLKTLLEGNSAAYAPLEQRLGELLRLDDETASKAVVEAVMAAVRANVIGAKRDVTAAAGTIYREQLGAAEQLTALREEVRQGGETARAERREIVGEIRSRAGGGAAYRLITGKQATALETPKLLAELAEVDRLTADEASAALGDSGPAGLASWARTHMDTLRAYPGRVM